MNGIRRVIRPLGGNGHKFSSRKHLSTLCWAHILLKIGSDFAVPNCFVAMRWRSSPLKLRILNEMLSSMTNQTEHFFFNILSHLRLGKGGFLMMSPPLHSSHKQQRPPSDLCSPRRPSLPHCVKQKRNESTSEPIQIRPLFPDRADAYWNFTCLNMLPLHPPLNPCFTPTAVEIVSGGELSLVPCFKDFLAKADACFMFQQMFTAETTQRQKLRDGISFRYDELHGLADSVRRLNASSSECSVGSFTKTLILIGTVHRTNGHVPYKIVQRLGVSD